MINQNTDESSTREKYVMRAIRQSLGKTQDQMAQTLGMHRLGYQKWERGDRGINLSFEQVVLLERELAAIGKRFSDYWPEPAESSSN